MLRIVTLQPTDDGATLRLEGRIIGPWVDELRRSCDRVLATGATLTLDVGEVAFLPSCSRTSSMAAWPSRTAPPS